MTLPKKSTITDLPTEIEALIPANERTTLIHQILYEAREGEFHDFKNEKYICGKVQVAQMLHETGDIRLEPIRMAIINGEYDESPDDTDLQQMKSDWLIDGGTGDLFDKLMG